MIDDDEQPPIYTNPTAWRLEHLERRMTKVEDAVISKNEALIRLDERTSNLSREMSELRKDVSSSLRNMTRAFYGTGVLMLTIAFGVIADLITR